MRETHPTIEQESPTRNCIGHFLLLEAWRSYSTATTCSALTAETLGSEPLAKLQVQVLPLGPLHVTQVVPPSTVMRTSPAAPAPAVAATSKLTPESWLGELESSDQSTLLIVYPLTVPEPSPAPVSGTVFAAAKPVFYGPARSGFEIGIVEIGDALKSTVMGQKRKQPITTSPAVGK